MRKVDVKEIENALKDMSIKTNFYVGEDVLCAFHKAEKEETSPVGRDIISNLLKNAEIAKNDQVPICQDTGMAVVFVEVGQEVELIGGNITDAINEGVRRGYKEGYLRKSVVEDPLKRKNTGDNTPAVIYYDIVPGDKVKVTLAPKGFGSENMSRLKMLKPSDGLAGVLDFVVEAVSLAGPNPCPPIVVGVGIGGTSDKAMYLAKKALTRDIGSHNKAEHLKEIELTLLEKINALGIGPQGLGGNTTALAVNVEAFATHIAGLPVAVNINCHVARHAITII
ncbi:fumarate hydratase [Clostridium estertheticum]|uniref:fumarate hydratase n=1 Tax=Clostridium estertheticum TaxID=238834 RepID=UPI001C7D6FA0|nr:fumarate hydratase [Clostridium estertheticum]MBX4265941.1 fumarate hydratase [Clostridium estertheticum]MBX4268678.1 fumarate hydratase [Clostridium estertheticum]WLC79120.1 fumarate hydratase [Clostridium estertheticum]WLC90139.1 fumarate hydratase [Clostridium estertheticum]